jgi:hypothetical protein
MGCVVASLQSLVHPPSIQINHARSTPIFVQEEMEFLGALTS